MCGIVGMLSRSVEAGAETLTDAVLRMADRVKHRGPDDVGAWVDAECGIGLGHRRLSIIDTSPAGHQPMLSPSGRYVLVFNGEIYNHLAIRRGLAIELGRALPVGAGVGPSGARVRWRGSSDTETLLAAIDRWGIERALREVKGMFAFAVWDRELRRLTLARDRVGEKPLYFGWQNGTLLFGSELKAIAAHPQFAAQIDRRALGLMLRFQCVPSPYAIYDGMHKLMPGCSVTVTRGSFDAVQVPYWSASGAISEARAEPFVGDERSAINQLEVLLRRVIESQMMSDVPLGAFLSGGVDSSTVVALMQSLSARPVQTFTIGFHESAFDESAHAKSVARYLGTDHSSLYLSGVDALQVVPDLPEIYDEPFSDSSQIPTYLVAKLARTSVAVSLSGDGGDEVFAGYNRYRMTSRYWGAMQLLPLPVRQALSGAVLSRSEQWWEVQGGRFKWLLRAAGLSQQSGYKIRKAAGVLTSSSADELYQGLVSHWASPSEILAGPRNVDQPDDVAMPVADLGSVEKMMALDLARFLPDDILVKVDRAGMAVSLETRMPLLDQRVVEFAWRLPVEWKLRQGVTKWILRQVLYRYVPRQLIERPKMGFGMPIGAWLRGPLRSWAEDLLDVDRIRREGFLEPGPIKQRWNEHVRGTQNWEYHLWDVLMFQAWLAAQPRRAT